jgi:CubicO group peptidase (beta-lactamase class C family)
MGDWLRVRSAGLIVIVMLIAATMPRAERQASAELEHKIGLFTRYLDPLRAQASIPGLSATVVAGGRVVWEGGFGYADVEARIGAAPDTPYRIASLTKTFASMLLLKCVENGTLDLDQPMRSFGLTAGDLGATVRQVLAMASDPPGGSAYRYDGNRYATLTTVVDVCARAPFRQALQSQILDRLGMIDSVPGQDLEAPAAEVAALFDAATLTRHRSVIARLAKPYATQNGRAVLADYPPRGINAAAGLISTVRDLVRYNAAIDAGTLLRRETQTLAWTPFVLSGGPRSPYGLGWFTQSTTAGRAVWHYGLWPTFSSLILKLPERDVALILLANSDGLNARFPLADGDVTVSPFARAFIAAVK